MLLIQVKGEKIINIASGHITEEQKKIYLKEGYIEVTDNVEPLDFSRPLMYKGGEIVIDKAEEEKQNKRFLDRSEINDLKHKLLMTDYIIIKIAEGVATAEEYADTIAERAKWRERINEIQKEVEL